MQRTSSFSRDLSDDYGVLEMCSPRGVSTMGRYLVWLLCSCMLFACLAEPHDQFGVLGQEVIGDC